MKLSTFLRRAVSRQGGDPEAQSQPDIPTSPLEAYALNYWPQSILKTASGNGMHLADLRKHGAQESASEIKSCGALRSVHLFHERTLIGHEYVLLRFVTSGGIESWLRVERGAAQTGRPGHRGSATGLTKKGAALAQVCSFGGSQHQLSRHTDTEIASLTATMELLPANINMTLFSWITGLGSTYRLFWEKQVARAPVRDALTADQLPLLVARGMQLGLLQATPQVHGHVTTPEEMLAFLRQERFGGHLYPEAAFSIHADLFVSDVAVEQGRYEIALKILEPLDARTDNEIELHRYRIDQASENCYRLMGRPADATRVLERMLNRPLEDYQQYQILLTLSLTLASIQEYDAATSRIDQTLQLLRASTTVPEPQPCLAFAHMFGANVAMEAGQFAGVLEHGQCAIDILRLLVAASPKAFEVKLADALLVTASGYFQLELQRGNKPEGARLALPLALESLASTRRSPFAKGPEGHKATMLNTLGVCWSCYHILEQFEQADAMLEEEAGLVAHDSQEAIDDVRRRQELTRKRRMEVATEALRHMSVKGIAAPTGSKEQ